MQNKQHTITVAQNFLISLGCAAPLIGTYYIIPRSTFTFDFYDHYFIFIILHLYNIFLSDKTQSILPSWLIKGFSVFVLTTLVAATSNQDAFNFAFFKQLFGAVFSASSYFIIFKLANFNLINIFSRYLNFAFFASLFAIIEEFLHLAGVHIKPVFFGPIGIYRVGGLSGEPYNLSLALFPALFYCLSTFFNSNIRLNHERKELTFIKSIPIYVAFFLTFSSTGYIGLFLTFLAIAIQKGYFNIKKPKIIFASAFFVCVYFVFAYLTTSNQNFNQKIQDGLWFLQGEEKESSELDKVNSSSFALLSNYYITAEGFKDNPFTGIGLGNYEMLYNDKFRTLFGFRFQTMYGRQNYNDANSMFLRLLAETGLIGILVVFYFIFSRLIKKGSDDDPLKYYLIVINQAILILFLIRLLRCGNYFSDGMFFFVLLFYYSSLQFKRLTQFEQSKLQKLNVSLSARENIPAPL